jgi:hypothetical protein
LTDNHAYILAYSALPVTTLALIFSLTYRLYGKGAVCVLFLRFQGIMLNGWKCRCFTVSTVFFLKLNLKIHRLLILSNSQPFSKIVSLKSYMRLFDLTSGWNLISCLFWCNSLPLLSSTSCKTGQEFSPSWSNLSRKWCLTSISSLLYRGTELCNL